LWKQATLWVACFVFVVDHLPARSAGSEGHLLALGLKLWVRVVWLDA